MTESSSAAAAVPDTCPFCAIAAGRAPAHIVHESKRLVAFLDTQPLRSGHLRIVPRDHYPHFNALPPCLAKELLDLGQRLAEAQRAAFQVARVGFLFAAGGETLDRSQGHSPLAHAQVEAVPLLSAADVMGRHRSSGHSGGAREADLARVANRLRRQLAAVPCELSTIK